LTLRGLPALSDDQYRLLLPLVPPAKPGGLPGRTDMRHLLDGLFYVVRTGCQWRHLPPAFAMANSVGLFSRLPCSGFAVVPRRWVGEKSLGWLGRWRRLSRDYEEQPVVSDAMVILAMIRLMLHRLVHPNRKRRPAP
jgi:transposase